MAQENDDDPSQILGSWAFAHFTTAAAALTTNGKIISEEI